jgi:Domain of unknown function (DUF4279)
MPPGERVVPVQSKNRRLHTYSVQFRISGERLVPDEITQKLDLQPNQVRIAGEKGGRRGVWDRSLWSYDGTRKDFPAPKDWDSLEDGLLCLLQTLGPKTSLVRTYIDNFDVFWWCGHFQSSFDGGPTLSAALLRQLADFGVPLILDNYFTDESDD